MKKKLLLTITALICALTCAFGLVACDNGDTPSGGSNTIAVENVTLNKTTFTLDIDGTETLTATVTPDNATDKTVTWSSSAPTIASVDSTGKVTAKAEGTATITAKTANDKTATCAVTVNAPAPTTEVTAEQWQAALSETAFTNFTATLTITDGYTYELLLKADLENGKYYYNDNSGRDNYYANIADAYYKYEKSNAATQFSREEISQSRYENQLYYHEALGVIMFKDRFAEVTFNDVNNSYSADEILLNEQLFGIEFKFEDGKLIYAKIIFIGEGVMEIEYDYSETSITLPTNFTDISGEDKDNKK